MFKCFLLQFSCFQQPHFNTRNNLSSSTANWRLTVCVYCFLINKNLQPKPRIESSQNIDAISEKIFLFIIDCVLISRAGISHQQQQAAAWEWDQFFRTMKTLAWQMTRDTRLWVIRRNDLPGQSQDLPWPPGRGSLAWEESFCGCWTNCSLITLEWSQF